MTWACDRILVGTDGSGPGLAALGWAARLCDSVASELVAVWAYDPDGGGGEAEATRGPVIEPAEAQRRLERWCAEHGALAHDARAEAHPGDPRSVLLDAIGREHPDLVVAGTRGGGGFPGLVVGSVAEWLSGTGSFPLAVVPHGGHDRTGGPLVVGVDGSPQSVAALTWAVGLAGRLGCDVHAVYGVAPRLVRAPVDDPHRYPGFAAVEVALRRGVAEAGPTGVQVDLEALVEHPVLAIARRADEELAEVIVVGARGIGAFGERTVGRVPRQLLHVARRPVVIIPRDGRPEAG